MLVHGGLVLAEDGAARPADIRIRGGVIERVDAPGTLHDHERLDAGGCLVLPGFFNGHTHGHGALARGAVPDCIALEGFLACGPALIGQRSVEDLRLSTLLSAVELARKGCTGCIDMAAQLPLPTVEGILAVGQAYAEVGLRAVVAPMVSDRTLYQAYPALAQQLPADLRERALALQSPPAESLLAACREAQRHWPFDRRQVQLGIGPAIPLHCSDELLAGCAALSREFDIPLQTHLLESRAQALAQAGGESTVRRLQRLGCLTPRTSLAHGVWVDADDLALIAAAGAMLVHNPASNLRLGSGVAALREWLDAGARVALGTDASNTSDGQNMFEVTRLASYLSRVGSPDWGRWVDAREAHGLATAHARIGPGAAADLVLIDLAQPHYVPLRNALRQLVLGENGAGVKAVVVAGRTVFAQGRLAGVDEAALRALAHARAAALDQACDPAREFAEAVLPSLGAFCCGAGRAAFRRDDATQ